MNYYAQRLGLLAVISGASGLAARADLVIQTTFDTSVQSLPNAAAVENAFNYAAQQFDSLIRNDITVNINVVADPSTGLGASTVAFQPSNYDAVRGGLLSHAVTANANLAANSLPLSDPTSGASVQLTTANAKAIGLVAANATASDGSFFFNPNLSFALDPNNRVETGKYDFVGLAFHEITEILGRNNSIDSGSNDANSHYSGTVQPYDLFRFTGAGARSLNPKDANVYFSINGGVSVVEKFNGPGNGGDIQDWVGTTNPNDACNAFGDSGQIGDLTEADKTALEAIGYNLSTVPEPAMCAPLAGLGALGFALIRRRILRG
jgi:hypothetical protein